MANKKISQLTPVTSVSDNDVFPVVQGSATLKAKISDIKSYLPTANGTTTGLLTNADWTTFNGKQSALTFGNLSEATSNVLTVSGGTGAVIGSGATIQVKQASASQGGYLSSADWSTFNSKQNSLTLTTTGTSGAATLVGSTLNIPQYPGNAITSLNSQTGSTQTFSTGTTGTDFAISSVADDHKFNIPSASASARGLLTSADWSTFNSKEPALTKGNLTESTSSVLTITGGTGAVIGSGLTVEVKRSGASQDGYLKSSDFNTFAAKQNAISLTTTGSSGAATLVGSTLNIPQYAFNGIVDINGLNTGSQYIVAGTSGTDLNISSASDTHTINIPDANSTNNRGLLTKTDWTTFNGKQNAITLTTTGTSGAATLVGSTLNIPQYGGGWSKINATFTESLPTFGSAIIAEPITCTLDRSTSTGNLLFDQRLFFIAVYVPSSMTITGVKWIQATQGSYTSNNYNGVGLYTFSSGTYTRVAQSTDDGNIWKATGNTMSSKAFSSTYSASAGIYFIAMLYCRSAQTTAPTFYGTPASTFQNYTIDFTNSSKTQGLLLSQTSMPR